MGSYWLADASSLCSSGSLLLPDTVTHAFRRIADRAGVLGFRLHDLRHTHANLLLQQNVHPKVVQERLGHANISATLDIYSHVLPGIQEEAARRYEQALSKKVEKRVLSPVVG